MLLVFQRHVASVCSKCFICFRHVASVLIWMLHMFHTYVARVCSKYFQLFHCYVAVNIFMLQVFYLDVAYDSRICCKCIFQMFHLFQTYVAFKCFGGMFRESWEHGPGTGGRDAVSRGRIDGAHACLVLRTRRARPHPGS
jgi:hypothetical protein